LAQKNIDFAVALLHRSGVCLVHVLVTTSMRGVLPSGELNFHKAMFWLFSSFLAPCVKGVNGTAHADHYFSFPS
jgi:hypothetical protein